MPKFVFFQTSSFHLLPLICFSYFTLFAPLASSVICEKYFWVEHSVKKIKLPITHSTEEISNLLPDHDRYTQSKSFKPSKPATTDVRCPCCTQGWELSIRYLLDDLTGSENEPMSDLAASLWVHVRQVRKSTRLNSSHPSRSRMPSSAWKKKKKKKEPTYRLATPRTPLQRHKRR